MDNYQTRYLEHQKRKAEVLASIIKERHSNRVFANKPLLADSEPIQKILEDVKSCPSSCDRQAINLLVIGDRDQKALLGGLLVGGVGWIHRAPIIILLMADPVAYKAGDEISYMPYLDAGIVVQQLYLSATANGLHCAFANPNIRDFNKDHFTKMFGGGIFCGAFAVGYPEDEPVNTDFNFDTTLR